MEAWSLISGIIGILGFVLSLFGIMYSMLRENAKIIVDHIQTHVVERNNPREMYSEIYITNTSSMPIAIRSVCVEDDYTGPIPCRISQEIVRELITPSKTTGREVAAREYSAVPPITLGPYEAFRGIFIFPCEKNVPLYPIDNVNHSSQHWVYTFETSRGKVECRITPPNTEELFTDFPSALPYVPHK